ncbi:MAG: signal peptidase I [Candidatus Cohnella colombiensis]|uniref:Signal peptidase I n=1 Tax=Candidatus Cohnella colombiensis TaxID=3121368 RepID=A0AA95EUH3_9BACL|nr:MAG: signal peptidase I [Cohnella sp.]
MTEQSQTVNHKRRVSEKREKRPMSGWKKELWDWTKALGISLIVVLLLRAYVFQLTTVKNISMQPTLYEGEWLFVNKISYQFTSPNHQDVIILEDPDGVPDHKDFLVKRIVGVPGDTIEIRNHQLYVNGTLTIEPYTEVNIEDSDFGPVTVTQGHYFVMGDNRHLNGSRDSRAFHEISADSIQGRAELILWPISRWAKL